MFTMIEKPRTEYKLIDQIMNELTQVMQKIEALEASAEENRIIAEELRKSETMNREVIEQLEEQLVQEKTKSDALSKDLERMTAQRHQLETEIKDMQESMNKQMVMRDAVIEKLKSDLQQETTTRKDAAEQVRKSFTQIQDLMKSVMGPSNKKDQ